MRKNLFFVAGVGLALALAAPAAAQMWNMIPPKAVALTCEPLPYVFHCAISPRANAQFDSNCFYVAEGRSYLMRSNGRWGYANSIVRLKIQNNVQVTGTVTELATGATATCVSDE